MESFYWVSKHVAGCSHPRTKDEFSYLTSQGITTIVNLTEEVNYPDLELLQDFQIESIPIEDFSVPTIEQVKQLWQLYLQRKNNDDKMVLHCFAGCGRTGTMTASLLLLINPELNVQQAIDNIRELRPCSLEVESQEKFVREVYEKKDEIKKL